MPAVTLWLFGVGGAALAAREGSREGWLPRQGARVTIGAVLLASCVGPALILVSQNRYDDAETAYNRNDCGRAIEAAADSVSALDMRPQPYEVIAYCQARRGNYGLAVQAMREAAKRDPENWQFEYGLALTEAAAGLDALPEAKRAWHLNRQNSNARDLVILLRTRDRAGQRRGALNTIQSQPLTPVG
jgi:tetratricopeptide (TPR) repeat protein